MREGLRSQKRLGGPETNKVSEGGVVQKKGGCLKQEILDVAGEDLAPEREALEKRGWTEQVVKEECVLDCGVRTRRRVALAKNGNSRSYVNCRDNTKEADVDRNVKKESSNDKVLTGGRVLRSMSKRVDGKKSYNEESNAVFSLENRELGGFEKIKVKAEYEEADEFVSNGHEKEWVKLKMEGTGESLKRKRGRPPKIELEEEDQLVGQVKCKHQGLPNAGPKNHLLTVAHNRKGKTGIRKGKKGSSMTESAIMNVTNDVCRSPVKLEKKEPSPVEKSKFANVLETENSVGASPLRSNTLKTPVAEKSGRTKAMRRTKAKQLVREQIMELLSAAGWTVDYRPRNGKEYNDAVYVSPDGKTHWSITLAYNRLKNHCEAGDGEGKVYRPGFKFTPIPAEDFNILTKVISKKRASKKKSMKKEGKGGNTVDGVNRKVKMGKLGSGASSSKSTKGKTKRRWSVLEGDSPVVTSPNRMPVLVRDHKRQKTQSKKRCALLVRNAEEEVDSEVDGYVPYNGKRTVLAWMIDLGTILQNGKVHYRIRRRKVLDGKITGDGIHCGCCNKIITISDFEVHAGSKLSDPLKNIYIEEGTSLLQCLLDSWNKQDESERKGFHFIDVAGEDPNDDSCGICGDGGDLICCDGCPSTFHQSCLDIERFPSGEWHCIYCCCKFCGLVHGSAKQSDSYDDFTVTTLLTCHLCGEKYHRCCIQANGAHSDDSRDSFFCADRCQELSERIAMLFGVKHEIEDGFSWTLIQRSDVGFDASQLKPQMVECNSKLAVALSIMDECFMPYIDHRSGINLIHSILYNCGSNFNRLNYRGFVTAILERGDEIISAASIRIHGNTLAEMPFIGTRNMYRRQGMCRRLLNAVERALSFLNVELLVIPAISELTETWTSVFGFEPLESTSKQIIKNKNLLVFPHVDMLQKKISKQKFADENLIPAEVSYLLENQTLYKVANNCDVVGSSGSALIISAGIPPTNACQAVDDNLIVEDKNTTNAHDYPSDTCCQAEDMNASQHASSGCTTLKHVEKPAVLDSQWNNCCVEERQCLTASHTSPEATEEGGHNVSALESTENFPNDVKVAYEIGTNNTSDENSGHCSAEIILPDLKITFCTRESKDSADIIHHDSHKVSDGCKLRSNTDSQTPNHQSILVSSGFCQKIADGVNERSKASIVAEANNNPWMKGPPELAEPDLRVDQTAKSNATPLCGPNTTAGVALHWASAGGASRGGAEVMVLSNQAS